MTSAMKIQAHAGIQKRPSLALSRPARTAVRQRQVAANALATQVVISGATAASLALGRFVFLPFQRDNVARQGLGESSLKRSSLLKLQRQGIENAKELLEPL